MPDRARAVWWWLDAAGNVIPGATVEVRNKANTAAITDTIYAADDPDTSVLPNPFTSDVNGKAEAYLVNAQRAVLRFSKSGYATQDVPVDFSFVANRFTFRGAWANTTAYRVDDVVTYGNESWIALTASTGVTPVQGANWSLMAAKGTADPLGTVAPPAIADAGAVGTATSTARQDHTHALHPDTMRRSIGDAKGDLIGYTADNTPARIAIGTEGTTPVARAAAVSGIAWEAAIKQVEAKVTAASTGVAAVTWTQAFATVPVVQVSVLAGAAFSAVWTRSTTGAEVLQAYDHAGNIASVVRMVTATEAT